MKGLRQTPVSILLQAYNVILQSNRNHSKEMGWSPAPADIFFLIQLCYVSTDQIRD